MLDRRLVDAILAAHKPADVDAIVFGSAHVGNRWVLSDTNGKPCSLAQWLELPESRPAVGGAAQRERRMELAMPVVYDLYDKRDIRWKYQVAGLLVETARRLNHGDTQYEYSTVVCGPRVAKTVDLRSDAFMPQFRADLDPLDDGYVTANHLCCVVDARNTLALGYDFAAYLYGWSDQGRAYQAVIGPRAYKRRPECVVVIPETLWERYIPAFRDLTGQQSPCALCVHLVDHSANPEHAVLNEQLVATGITADRILKTMERHESVSANNRPDTV